MQPEIFERFPGLRVAVAVATGVDNTSERPGVEALWRDAWQGAAAQAAPYGKAQDHPRVRAWREGMRALGVSPRQFPSSIEATLRRALKAGEPFRVNPLVDFYNAVSLRQVVPAGGFDLAGLADPLELRLTGPGDAFQALDEAAPSAVPEGEVAYAVGSDILTRHFVWRQSRRALITPSTRDALLLAEALGGLGPDVADAALEDLAAGLETHFGVTPRRFIVDERRPSVSWEGAAASGG